MNKNLLFKFQKLAVLIALLLGSVFSQTATTKEVPSSWKFLKISTPHFEIIYNAKQQALADYYAFKMEQAYSKLDLIFTSKPERTIVVLLDKTDTTNGYATRFPYPHIVVYPVLPTTQDSLGESDDWVLELLSHEYTHIINFEPANGFFWLLRKSFGSIISTNLLLPRWWKEGIAVEVETQLSRSGGRLRSNYQDAVIRSMSKDATLLRNYDIAKANEILPSWPEGLSPYLFGSLFWSEFSYKYNLKNIDNLNESYGGRVPYLLNTPFEEITGKNYEDFYNDMLLETNKKAQNQIQILKTKPISNYSLYTSRFQYTSQPQINDSGKYLAFIGMDENDNRTIQILTKNQKTKGFFDGEIINAVLSEEEPVSQKIIQDDGPPGGSIQRINWFHKSDKLIYDLSDYTSPTEKYSDLYLYDLNLRKTERLTTAERAREPSVSLDDQLAVYVKLEGGFSSLALIDLNSKTTRTIYTAPIMEMISYPSFINSNEIIFSKRKPGGESLWIYNYSTHELKSVLTNFPNSKFPTLTNKGLIFSSTLNGVPNLYLASENLRSAKPITHSLTAATTSTLDPSNGNIYFTSIESSGLKLAFLPLPEWMNTPNQLPHVSGLFVDRYPQKSTSSIEPALLKNSVVSDYNANDYLLPTYWLPFITTSTLDNSILFDVSTSQFDPLKKHNYLIDVMYDSGLQKTSFITSYQNNVYDTSFGFTAFNQYSYLISKENISNNQGLEVSLLPEIWWLQKFATLTLSWKYNNEESELFSLKRTGPGFFYNYTNFAIKGAQFAPEDGYAYYLGATHYITQADYVSHSQFFLGGNYFYSKGLNPHHSIAIKYSSVAVPERIPSIYGTGSESYTSVQNKTGPSFLLRGFRNSQFIGRNIHSINLEYRFPIKDYYKGDGIVPFFTRNLHAAILFDGMALDGIAYNEKAQLYESINTSKNFASMGGELRLNTTVGYLFPITLIFGVYSPLESAYSPSTSAGISMQIGADL